MRLLVLSNEDHHVHASKESKDFHDRLFELAVLQQLWDHGHGGDVNEAAGSEGKDPGSGRLVDSLGEQRNSATRQSTYGRNQLEENGLCTKETLSSRHAHKVLIERTFFRSQPDWMRMAKSPISCGTSCRRTVTVVTMPVARPAKNEAPIASPSVKLWAKSAARLR